MLYRNASARIAVVSVLLLVAGGPLAGAAENLVDGAPYSGEVPDFLPAVTNSSRTAVQDTVGSTSNSASGTGLAKGTRTTSPRRLG